MTATGSAGIKQYQQIDTQSNLATATPHRLVQMLMERALTKMGLAKAHMQRGEIQEKGSCIGVAISIVNMLQASLNHKANARMSANFDELYAYMMRRLLQANVQNDPAILDEVSGLLQELKDAWDAITDQVEQQADSDI
ncbi:MAG: flagellar export chaperone FliS [Woeseia sp.]